MPSQFVPNQEQLAEQDRRYYNPDDYDERLAFDLDPDRHTPAEFWGAEPPVRGAVAVVEPPKPSSEALYQAWLAENPDFRAKQQARDAERARQDKIMWAKWNAEIEKGRANAN